MINHSSKTSLTGLKNKMKIETQKHPNVQEEGE